ncbi:hypothetical protein [Shimazuella alba]|uniref:Uncharacterized protein n=1 Tax=Shimazuella alba TaxID=2690964 RepID=A0A6I4VZN3_9BACL|nr:hypothetical protein [Shimazuella alba]MXQ55186.1 hypothetical protein [Shimazuella alba]
MKIHVFEVLNMDKEQKLIDLQSLLNIPDNYQSKEEINRTAIESREKQMDETQSLSEYLGL